MVIRVMRLRANSDDCSRAVYRIHLILKTIKMFRVLSLFGQ